MTKIRSTIHDIGGRRFILAVGCGLVCTALLIWGHIDQNIYRDLVIATIAVYIAGNTTQKISEDKYGVADE